MPDNICDDLIDFQSIAVAVDEPTTLKLKNIKIGTMEDTRLKATVDLIQSDRTATFIVPVIFEDLHNLKGWINEFNEAVIARFGEVKE